LPDPLDPEDAKLVTLARSSRARTQLPEGAAVRDLTGRTYVATTVQLPSLQLTALQSAVAAAVASGAEGLEAAVVVSDEGAADPQGAAAVRDLAGTDCPVLLADSTGAVVAVSRT
jgi:cytidine deaminase